MLWLISSWFSTTKDWHYMHGRTSWFGVTHWIGGAAWMFYLSVVLQFRNQQPFSQLSASMRQTVLLPMKKPNRTPPTILSNRPRCFCTEQATWILDIRHGTWLCLNSVSSWSFFPHLTSSLGSREAIQLIYASKTALPLKTSEAFDYLASIPEVQLLFVVWSHQFTTDLPRTVRSPGVCNPFQPAEV